MSVKMSHRLGFILLAALLLGAIPALAEDVTAVPPQETAAPEQPAPEAPVAADAALVVPLIESAEVAPAAGCNECFISCPLTHYACCISSCPTSCTCQPLSQEVNCDVYGFPNFSVRPPVPGQCSP